jgi:hypothetical protein
MRHFQILLTLFVTLTLSGLVAESHAEPLDSLPTVELETPIHFLAPDGSDVVIESGRYQVEAAESWIRLIPGERRDALLLIAESAMHDEPLDAPQADLRPVDGDTQTIVLLLPGGRSLEAIGSVSGVRSRAITRRRTARTPKSPQKISRLPAQIRKRPAVKKSMGSKRRPPQRQQSGSPASTSNPAETNVHALTQRVQTLEQQVNSLLSVIQIIQGGAIIQAQNLSIQSHTLTIETDAGLTIASGANLGMNARLKLTARSGTDLKLKGDTNAKLEGGATTTVKGGAQVKVEGGSRLDLKGPVVYLGSGSGMKPVAVIGSMVNSVGGIGVSTGTVTTGSATVFAK